MSRRQVIWLICFTCIAVAIYLIPDEKFKLVPNSQFDVISVPGLIKKCGTTTEHVRLRSVPSTSGQIYTTFDIGVNLCFLKFLDAEGYQWGQVEQTRTTRLGWVALKYVSDLSEVQEPSTFELKTKLGNPQCLYNKYQFSVISNKTLAIGEGLQNLTTKQLTELDELVSKTMKVDLRPVIVWWVKGTPPEEIKHFFEVTRPEDDWGAKTVFADYFWDGCELKRDIRYINTTLIIIKFDPSVGVQVDRYVHERSHSLFAIHGKASLDFQYVTPDNPYETGSNDAYWWTYVGFDGYYGTCTRFTDPIYQATCKEVTKIVH